MEQIRPKGCWVGSQASKWRQSIKLPYADWLPHERVSSQAYLLLATGVGIVSGLKGDPENCLGCPPDPRPNRPGEIAPYLAATS
jgi:hypothetical protein